MRCPNCHKHYRTLEDEDGDHDCPYCGSSPDADEEDKA